MRLHRDTRRAMIVNAGAKLARATGLKSVTFDAVAEACPVPTSAATVRYHFTTYRSLWLSIAKSDRDNLWDQAVAMGVVDAHQ